MLPGHPDDDETSFTGSLSSGVDDESIEDTLAREQRWDDLVARLVERAEAATETSDRAQSLLRAALVYEAKLDDVESAFQILKTAFHEDFTNEAVANELARVTTAANKWPALVAECEELIPRLPNDRRRVELLLALAHFYEIYLRDLVAAEQILDGALALDPRDLTARRALATMAARRGDWGRAVEHLAAAAETSRNSLEKVRLHLEAASVYETQLSDFENAARQYQRVLQLNPANAIARGGLDRIAPELEDQSVELGVEFTPEPDPLPLLETPKPISELAPAHFQAIADPAEEALAVARAAMARGDAPAAVEALGRALQEQPQHRACREAMIEASSQLGDHAAATHHRRALLPLLENDGERFDLLSDSARKSRDDAKDLQGAITIFQEALALRPDDPETLHDVLDLYSRTKQWKQAIEVLKKLAAAETGKARARYLVAMANILNYELRSADEAVDLYNQALDEDPDDLKSFERIEKILGAKRAWRDEARNFRRMLKRLGPTPPPEKRPVALMLWKGLGEICRTRLKDFPAAMAAFEVCASLDPADSSYHEILAELFEREGPVGQALEKRTLLLGRALGGPEQARHLRAMLKLHSEAKHADRVWCTCAALVACGQADAQEGQWYDRLAERPLARPRGAVGEEMWQRALYHPREDRRLSRLFSAIAPTVVPLHAKDARGLGLDERLRISDDDPSLLSQLISYACFVLGVGRPAIYLDPRRVGLEPVMVAAEGRLHPSLVVGGDLSLPRPEREVAFLVGRAIGVMRFEHMVLWQGVVSSSAELKAMVLGLIKAFQPSLVVSGMEGPVKQYHSFFQRHLPPHAHEALMAVVPSLAAEGQAIDVAGWAAGANLTANRAGLVVCGDLTIASRAAAERPGKGLTPEEVTSDLLAWSVSPEHLALREQLGLAIENAGVGTAFGARPTAAGGIVDDRQRGR